MSDTTIPEPTTTEPTTEFEPYEPATPPAEPKRAEAPDVDQVLADAEAELAAARAAEDEIIRKGRSDEDDAGAGVEVQMVCAVYEDPDAPHSRFVNPNRNKTVRVFEIKHGRSTPEDSMDINWLVWHSLGRPGKNGARPAEPAIGAAEDQVFHEWYDSVEHLHNKTVTRGKAS